VEKSNTQYQ